MSNRRYDYRHHFAPDDRLRVELAFTGGRRAVGQIVDMSVGGIAVALDDPTCRFDPADAVSAHFAIPHGLRRFALASAVVHRRAADEGNHFGLRFLPLDNLDAQESRDKSLWVFLLDEQRRERRQQLTGA